MVRVVIERDLKEPPPRPVGDEGGGERPGGQIPEWWRRNRRGLRGRANTVRPYGGGGDPSTALGMTGVGMVEFVIFVKYRELLEIIARIL